MAILVTGGAGYIGSHTVVELLNAKKDVIIVDDLSNAKVLVLKRLETITGKKIPFYKVDLKHKAQLDAIFAAHSIESVIHFAGYKAVGESVSNPLKYYENNLLTTINLLDTMKKYHVNHLVFSSSATVYGEPTSMPIYESSPVGGTTNPYGTTKLMNEMIIQDFVKVHPGFKAVLLRYFNPIGAHASGLIGEDPQGIPNNLMPYITQVAIGLRSSLSVFGQDYPTVDGTGVRDYIHVVDLAKGHLAALDHIHSLEPISIFNLGTGKGTSVLQLVAAFEKASQRNISYTIAPRRPGDIPVSYANCDKALHALQWRTTKTIEDACVDSWNWQSKNPKGYN
jgi:UDP-glucose 4-epimerase